MELARSLPLFVRDWTHSHGDALSVSDDMKVALPLERSAQVVWGSRSSGNTRWLKQKKSFCAMVGFYFVWSPLWRLRESVALPQVPAQPLPTASCWHVIVSLAFWSSSLMENVSSFVFIMHAVFEVVTGASARLLLSLSRLLLSAIVLRRIYSEERV